ncbi:MAG TPA: hypothetical protein VK790_05465 [Solirubrobacteraceae bacterium]|nr:hypothetical protein [Solirubrobacteraceae bacterium]
MVAKPAAAGSTLVVDRYRATHGDARLVAHLAADEPAENAALICARYLEDVAAGASHCRPLDAQDAHATPFDPHEAELEALAVSAADPPADRRGWSYSIESMPGEMAIPELRWCRRGPGDLAESEPASLREAIAALESYEPLCSLTRRALALHVQRGEVSTAVLRAELARVQESPIVLNRRLREVVLAIVARGDLSMSEIALRCGRIKRDRKGNESGETSWLARRLGVLPEGGRGAPTPWIHSDVLALIARQGLGISPREVEP